MKLSLAERLLHHLVKLMPDKAQALVHILWVATEIYCPQTRVAVALHHALHGVDKSMALAERDVQSGVHARSAKNVVKEIKGYAPVVVNVVGTVAKHHVGKVGVHVVVDVLGYVWW